MAKIVIDVRELRTSTGRYMERLVHYLQKVDTENKYVILLKPKDFDGWKPTNPNFTKVKTPYKEFTFGEQIGLKKQIKKLQADLVHFPMTQQPILYRGKVVTSILDTTTIRYKNPSKNSVVFWVKQQVYKFVTVWVARKSKQVITISNYVKKDVAKYCKIKTTKINTTYLAADTIRDLPVPVPELRNKQFIFYVGRPMPHKNLDGLMKAFEILKKDHPDLILVLGGKKDALYAEHEKTAKKMGLSDSVIFTGFISEGQLKWLYQNCRAYVFPSFSEGFGLPGLEAMIHRAPVAASEATCLPEVYGDAAQYFNPHDAFDMARTIDRILTDTRLRSEMIIAGRKRASEFSWQRCAEETLEVYKKALKS